MKKLLILIMLFCSSVVFSFDFEHNNEQLLDIQVDYVDGTNIMISKTYVYETYLKIQHYIYRDDNKIVRSIISYRLKEEK